MSRGAVPKSTWSLLFAIAFGCVFPAAGFWILFDALRSIVEGSRAVAWPVTTGTMHVARVVDTSDTESESCVVQVRYSYQVDGREYHGRTIHPAYRGSGFLDMHHRLALGLRPPRNVRVHYDDAHRESSTLVVGFYSSSLGGVFLGGLFVAIGACVHVVLWRKTKLSRSGAVTLLVILVALGILGALFQIAGDKDFLAGVTFVE